MPPSFSRRSPALWVLVVAACSPALDWREVRTEGDAVAAWFPCKPERHTRQVMLAGRAVTMQLLGCTADGTTWGLSSVTVGDEAQANDVLAALRRSRSANLEGREVAAEPLRLPGLGAGSDALRLSVVGRRPDGSPVKEEALLFARGQRVFHAAALGGTPSTDALESFFGNLKLRP